MSKTTIYEVEGSKLIDSLAEQLKKNEAFKKPEWANFVKTSSANERPPHNKDWWFKRAASILRQLQIKGVIGVNRLKRKYGGKKDRGHKPDEFRKGGGKIIRTILQQGEKAGLVQKNQGKQSGRELTKKGLNLLNKVAEKVKAESNSNK